MSLLRLCVEVGGVGLIASIAWLIPTVFPIALIDKSRWPTQEQNRMVFTGIPVVAYLVTRVAAGAVFAIQRMIVGSKSNEKTGSKNGKNKDNKDTNSNNNRAREWLGFFVMWSLIGGFFYAVGRNCWSNEICQDAIMSIKDAYIGEIPDALIAVSEEQLKRSYEFSYRILVLICAWTVGIFAFERLFIAFPLFVFRFVSKKLFGKKK